MKKYHVYGIGNALVDMEVEVVDQFLQDMKIEKGVMTLVEEERQNELLGSITDGLHKRSCGGSAANTVIAIAQLGGRAFYSCKVANDQLGDFYFKDLLDNGVETNLHGKRDGGITGKCMVFITPDGERTMNTFLGITENFSSSELIKEDIEDSEYLYIEGYLVTSETGRRAAIEAKKMAEESGVKTALTFSDPAMAKYFSEGLKEMIGNAVDLLFCNEEEALLFTAADDLKMAISHLKKVAKTFVITLGAKGAYLYDGEREINVETNKVTPLDTNGAGDLFAGSFLFGITHGHSFSDSAKLACHLSGKLVTQFGARLEKNEVSAIYEQLF